LIYKKIVQSRRRLHSVSLGTLGGAGNIKTKNMSTIAYNFVYS